ncbi:protein-tyrosine phosphatase [Isoptericola jiangsuensis]|uniref:Protein-tyrosine phosphatase n=1 Tax=Isoptericola jiangsuensis TaxID=548579 RepID=A0A2A9ETU3_9MICO|nr:tyrosine-protein phosphatase [Isoptericola jiangsuensis]PFG41655.1 protein-tyrosine phosphatase [Isoptericola jiangsuensis]
MTTLSPAAADLPLTAPVNLRDLGGVPVAGGTVRPGVVLRADDLSTVDQGTADRLVADGLRAVVDLRSTFEVGLTGRGPLGREAAVTFHHVPFLADLADDGQTRPDPGSGWDQSTFGPMYLRMVEGAAPQVVTALAIVAHSPGTVAFHCAAGQDRTGVLAAALLLALGAGTDDVVAEYARTGANSAAIQQRLAPVLAPLMAQLGVDLDAAARAAVRTEFSPEPMRWLVATLTERYGDPLAPLRAAGLTDGLVARLRERLVLAPDAAPDGSDVA